MPEASAGTMVLRLAVAAALILANGFFVAVEFAIVTVRRSRIEQLVAEGNTAARSAQVLLAHPDRFIAAAQLGITMASLALGWVGEATIAALIEPPLHALIGRWSEAAAVTIGTILAFAILTFLHIVLGEQVPKTASIRFPERAALFVARLTIWFSSIFGPFIWLLDKATQWSLRALGVGGVTGHHAPATVEELKLLVREGQESGVLKAHEGEMAVRVFEFSDRAVREVMIPRTDISAVESKSTVQELLQLFAQHSHSRFPVYENNLDHIVGMLMMKDVVTTLAEQGPAVRPRTLEEAKLIRPAFFVPESRRVGDLLPEMRAQKVHLAIVIDEFGGTSGIVTLEELIEEVVGRVSDEWVTEALPIKPVGEDAWEVDALVRVDEVNTELKLGLPEHEDYETVAGFLLWVLGHVPQQGEEARWEGLRFKVLEMKGPKIERVSIAREATEA